MYIKAANFVQNLRGNISPTERAVAQNMAIHASPPPEFSSGEPAGIATMSMALLARESSLAHRQTASDIVKRLVGIGIIAVYGKPSKGGNAEGNQRGRTTAYYFTFTVNPDSGVWETTAAKERAAAESSATQPSDSPVSTPKNDGECNPPVAPEPENSLECNPSVALESKNAESSAIPQLHEGLPSSSFRSFSESCAAPDEFGLPHQRGGSTNEEGETAQRDNPVVVGAERPPFLPDGSSGECAPHAHPTSGRLAAPTSGVPLPDASPAAGLKPSHEVQVKSGGQEREDLESRSEAIIDDARRRQIERKTSDAEIFREAKAVFDRLQQEYAAWSAVSWSERERLKLPKGAEIENALKTNAEHRHAFAEMYRSLGRDITLARWEHFLIHEDHTVTARGEGEIERTYLMEHFLQLNGVSTGVKS
jgi:hypothetical protein